MNIKARIVSVAIAIIFALFIGYGIEVFFPTPEYQVYCPDVYSLYSEEECTAAGGVWIIDLNAPMKVKSTEESAPAGFCQNDMKCNDGYTSAATQHDRILFIIAVIFGLLSVIVGIILQKEAVSSGLVGGGILLILYGTIRYWQHANNILKFVLLGVVLGVLVWLAYKKLEKK